jgi:hypothetical protein
MCVMQFFILKNAYYVLTSNTDTDTDLDPEPHYLKGWVWIQYTALHRGSYLASFDCITDHLVENYLTT